MTLSALFAGTSVVTVTASDADDQTYGNSAKLVYSILQGQPYFSVDSENGKPNPEGVLGGSFDVTLVCKQIFGTAAKCFLRIKKAE